MSRTYRWGTAVAVWLAVGASAVLSPGAAQAAETVHLYLKADGAQIKGESTQSSLGRQDSIECIAFTQGVSVPASAGAGLASGKRQYEPIVIRKRIDKSSPLLMKALAQGQAVEGEFRFFRPSPTGDGTTEQFYTIRLRGARIVACKLIVPSCIEPASANEPPQEEVSFSAQSISWTYTNGGITFEDSAKLTRDAEGDIQERGIGDAPKK